jgi:hypothetical protein
MAPKSGFFDMLTATSLVNGMNLPSTGNAESDTEQNTTLTPQNARIVVRDPTHMNLNLYGSLKSIKT